MISLTCLVIDDSPLASDIIVDYVSKTPFLHVKSTFTNPLDAIAFLQKEQVDLIFLDIQMPELTGIQFMKLLKGRSKVILVTAYQEYALEGYEHDVIDYLLKPVSFERFLRSVQKAMTSFPSDISPPLQTGDNTANSPAYLFVKTDGKIRKVNFSDILYIEGLKNYVAICLADGKKLLTLQTMKSIEEALPASRFFRVHKSFIISLDKIDSIERNRVFIRDKVIPVGDTYLGPFFKAIRWKM